MLEFYGWGGICCLEPGIPRGLESKNVEKVTDLGSDSQLYSIVNQQKTQDPGL